MVILTIIDFINEMSYIDFYIFKEHRFLRNIFSKEKLAKTKKIERFKKIS